MPDREDLWDEVGSHKPPTAYDGVLHRPCPNCGAKVDKLCTREITVLRNGKPVVVTVPRNIPCMVRLKAAS